VRNRARDLRRNTPYGTKIVQGIASNLIGTGILASCADAGFLSIFNQWADSTFSDSMGKTNYYGIQKLAVEALVESGEVLIVRQYDKKQLNPLRLKVLESDYLDHTKTTLAKGLVQGVQFDETGNITGYWLFMSHPGDVSSQSQLVPASEVIHLYRVDRPGQVRGMSWLTPVIINIKKLTDFEDALLEKQLISNLFTGFIYDANDSGGATPAATVSLEPGSLVTLNPGKQIDFSSPPQPSAPEGYLGHILRSIAAGVGIPYEILTGNLTEVNFSSARISWGEFQRAIDDWRWNLLVPQMLDRVWQWVFESSVIAGLYRGEVAPICRWTPPRRVMVDIAREIPAILLMIRAGLMTPSDAVREQGFNPADFWAEYAEDLAKLDELGIVLEADCRQDANRKASSQTPTP
jgi:lambda family phage portal protein